jgi:hypothetical protein
VLQSAEAGLLTGTLPGALAGYATAERTAIVYHDTATEWADVAWACSRLVWDPDVQSAAWDGPIAGVDAYATALTTTQRSAAQGIDVNLILPYGGSDTYVDAGKNGAGRPLYEIVSADWFYARLQERIADQKVSHAARGQKIPLTERGQIKIKAEIDALFEQGVSAGHFVGGQTESAMLAITPADTAAERFRCTGRAQIAVSGRVFSFSLNFGRDPLA